MNLTGLLDHRIGIDELATGAVAAGDHDRLEDEPWQQIPAKHRTHVHGGDDTRDVE